MEYNATCKIAKLLFVFYVLLVECTRVPTELLHLLFHPNEIPNVYAVQYTIQFVLHVRKLDVVRVFRVGNLGILDEELLKLLV